MCRGSFQTPRELPVARLEEFLESQLLDAGVRRGRLHSEQLRRATRTIDSAAALPQCGDNVFAVAALHFLLGENLCRFGSRALSTRRIRPKPCFRALTNIEMK